LLTALAKPDTEPSRQRAFGGFFPRAAHQPHEIRSSEPKTYAACAWRRRHVAGSLSPRLPTVAEKVIAVSGQHAMAVAMMSCLPMIPSDGLQHPRQAQAQGISRAEPLASLIRRWLQAGVLEDGKVYPSEEGTSQGGSISVLLSNLYPSRGSILQLVKRDSH
jgi:hypothetical protein